MQAGFFTPEIRTWLRTGEQPLRHWAVCNERDTQLLARRQHTIPLGRAVRQRILHLVGRQRHAAILETHMRTGRENNSAHLAAGN